MEIITQTIDTKKRLIDYICDELRKCIHLQPGQREKINLSLNLTKPEFFVVEKDESRGVFSLGWYKDNVFITNTKISTDINEMAKDVEGMVNEMSRHAAIEAEKESFQERCYELYQLEWMMSHGYSLDDLYKCMLKYEKEMFDPMDFRDSNGDLSYENEFSESGLERSAMQARDIFLFAQGFGKGHIFAGKSEFLTNEYLDAAYMKWLLETKVDDEADKLKDLYRKYTGIDLSGCCELKVHTTAGTLKAYKSEIPDNPGIIIMLQPKGYKDYENIDVAQALVYETDELLPLQPVEERDMTPLDVKVLVYGDAKTEDHTSAEIIKRKDIEKGLGKIPVILSSEELKKLITKEWIKFTFGEGITEGEIDNIPQDLLDEIAFRCDNLETDDITRNIRACLEYAKEHGNRALMKEMDDCNIWRYIA